MARSLFYLAVMAALVASSAAEPFLQVSLTFDNKASHALNNEKAVLEELAKELCWTDRKSVASIRLFDQSSALNTESRGVFACFPTKYSVEKMLEWCNAGKYQREFYDELTDRTMPDLEVEKYQCTICDTKALTANGPCFAKVATPVRIEKPPLPSRSG